MSFSILGLGTATPDCELSQESGMQLHQKICCTTGIQAAWVPNIYKGSGIRRRHIVVGKEVLRDVLEDTRTTESTFLPKDKNDRVGPTTGQRMRDYIRYAPALALQAARNALDQSELAPRDITHIVTVSCTGFRAPGVDIQLIQELGLAPTTQRTHVGYMGCHGALNGLRVARAITGAEPNARVLLCAVELCCLHFYYGWDTQKMIVNAIFSDGAAAVVGAAQGPDDGWKVRNNGSCVFPNSQDAMTWSISDHGFEMTLAKSVPDLIAKNLRPWLLRWLDQQGMRLEDVATWAVHPGGPRILTAVEEALELPASINDAAREILANHGNMSSPTILFLVDSLRKQQAPLPCVALAFGPGLTVEAALFQ